MAGSHAAWSRELARFSKHQVTLLTLPGTAWKWRMHGGAITLARQLLNSRPAPDLLLVSAMCDLTTVLALVRRQLPRVPAVVYFHENQLTYPWSENDPCREARRDAHYGFINLSSALAADAVWFNSHYHRQSFLNALPDFLKQFPEPREMQVVDAINDRSSVMSLGVNLKALWDHRPDTVETGADPLILWNHRWEYDKNPEAFFQTLFTLADRGVPFRLAVLGESFGQKPAIFTEARERLRSRIVQWGYVESLAEYAGWLWKADLMPVTSQHDFFGASVVQALYCGCQPLLPNRLAHPEHLPQALQGKYLYRSDEDLVDRLEKALLHLEAVPMDIQEHVAQYDWSVQAPIYDRALEQVQTNRLL